MPLFSRWFSQPDGAFHARPSGILVPAIWLPTFELRREREISRFRLDLVKHRSTLKNRMHPTLITFG
jgi:hypothetical protein